MSYYLFKIIDLFLIKLIKEYHRIQAVGCFQNIFADDI